jgi:hypothetical protein
VNVALPRLEEVRVQDPPAAERDERLRAVELAARSCPRLGVGGEERLLVQQVGAQERVAGELERLEPAPLAAELRDALHAPQR